jgi:hypothetical protein
MSDGLKVLLGVMGGIVLTLLLVGGLAGSGMGYGIMGGMGRMMGGGMMGGGMMGGGLLGALFSLLIWVLLAALVFALVVWIIGQAQRR